MNKWGKIAVAIVIFLVAVWVIGMLPLPMIGPVAMHTVLIVLAALGLIVYLSRYV